MDDGRTDGRTGRIDVIRASCVVCSVVCSVVCAHLPVPVSVCRPTIRSSSSSLVRPSVRPSLLYTFALEQLTAEIEAEGQRHARLVDYILTFKRQKEYRH